MKRILTLLTFFLSLNFLSYGQTTLSGILQDADLQPIAGVRVLAGQASTTTDESGFFRLEVPGTAASLQVVFSKEKFATQTKTVAPKGQRNVSLGAIVLEAGESQPPVEAEEETILPASEATAEDRIPIITLSGTVSDDENDDALGSENISGVLAASRDPFIAAASFNLSTGGFNIRGYEAETTVLFNGMPFNYLENGSVFFSTWGGLNDVTRNQETSIDLRANSWTFGGLGGFTAIDTRASEQRKGSRISYMYANRAYAGRLMATWSSGMMPSGWAFSFSGSKRWAEEGYVPGTFYNAYAYFASVDRRLGSQHLLNITALGTPSRRGGQGSAVQEMNDLAGTNFYNPNWGWQGGKKRNARVNEAHQPLFVLRHDWTASRRSKLTSALGYQTGKYGSTTLDWFKAPDPRADYYRKQPSYAALNELGTLPGPIAAIGYSDLSLLPQDAEMVEVALANNLRDFYLKNPEALQINWNDIYFGNTQNGKSWDGRPGNWSQVILSDQRSDANRLNGSATFESILTDHVTLNAGLTFQQEKTHYFKTVEDLLGGDYYVNVNRFISTSLTDDQARFNLEDDNVVVTEGDTHGWDYDITVRRPGAWAQGQFTLNRMDFFLAGNVSQTTFWRDGHYRDGRFPDNSFGKSAEQNFTNYGAKAGVTFKIDGRNYIYAHGAKMSRPPDARIAYASPRSRDQLIPGLTEEDVTAWEAGYQHRSPGLKARATFYHAKIENGLKLSRFFLPGDISNFGTYILSGLDARHAGLELAFQAKLTPTLSANGAASISENIYTSRPDGFFIQDDDGVIRDRGTIYLKNFYVPNSPQTALSFGLDYRSPNFWSASVTVNYFDRNYLDFSPERRTEDLVFGLVEDSDIYNAIVDQQRLPDAFSVDLFGNKSWKIDDDVFFGLTAGVTNLLNAEIIQGGFEQLRFERADVQRTGINVFQPRYFYAYGTNFFLLGALRF